MVLPAPAPHDEAHPAASRWLHELKLSLRLSKGAILLLVDRAQPERLGELVRALMEVDPKVVVSADVRDMATVPEGSLLVLLPKLGDAEWLNLQRPLISQRSLKVVLFCENETTVELSERAPDFFDWISQHQEAPPGLPMHAVLGLRAAFEAGEPILWAGANRERLIEVFSASFPGTELLWITPTRPYVEVVQKIGFATKKKAWVACRPQTISQLRRFRWAVAEAGRSSGVIVMTDSLSCPGYWPVHDRLMPLDEAYRALRGAGATRPGLLASLIGLEPEAVEIAQELLYRGRQEERLIELLRAAIDPGAALAEELRRMDDMSASSMLDIAMRRAAPPLLRALAREPNMMHLRSERFALIEGRLANRERVENDDLAAFAASAATRRAPPSVRCAPCKDVDAQSLLVETLLRRKAYFERICQNNGFIVIGVTIVAIVGMLIGISHGWSGVWGASTLLLSIVIYATGIAYVIGIKAWAAKASNIIKNSTGELEKQIDSLAIACDQGLCAEAEKGLEAMLDIARSHLDPEDSLYPVSLALYAHVLTELGDDPKGLKVLDELIGEHAVLLPLANFLIPPLTTILMRTGRPVEAEVFLRKLIGPEAFLRGNGQTQTIHIGGMSAETNEALALFLAQPGSPELSLRTRVESLRLLAEALLLQGRHDEAEDLLERAVVLTHDLTPDSQEQWRVRLAMGRALLAQGRHRDARNVLEIASTQAKDAVGETHPDYSVILEELARVEQPPGITTAAPG